MIYTHPQETWDTAEASRRARYAPKDAWGHRQPKGLIASNASNYLQYGQSIAFNGKREIDGELYSAEYKPLPIIPPEYEFYTHPAWGTFIRSKPVK